MKATLILFLTVLIGLLTACILHSCGAQARTVSCNTTSDRLYTCSCSAMKGDRTYVSVTCSKDTDTTDLVRFNVNLGE